MKLKWPEWLRSWFAGKKKNQEARELGLSEADHILYRLDLYMVEKKPFLQPRYTIRQLAEDIRVPAYQLSAIINLRKGMNFSDYLNKLRIRHCEQLIRIAGGAQKINIRDLSGDCGFQNRNTFTIAFKKFTGLTPSEYIKKHW
jgi:YesN/AraC family two-component response regulator